MHDAIAHRECIRSHILCSVDLFFLFVVPIEDIQECTVKIVDRCVVQLKLLRRQDNVLGQSCERFLRFLETVVQFRAGGPKRLVFTQLAKQRFLGIFLVLFLDRRTRQKTSGFDQKQLRRNRQEGTCAVHIQIAEIVHIRQILRRDFGNEDILDIDLRFVDQVQQQVERSFEL